MSNKDFSPYERKKKICGRIKFQGLILKYSKMIQKLNFVFENIIIDEHIYILRRKNISKSENDPINSKFFLEENSKREIKFYITKRIIVNNLINIYNYNTDDHSIICEIQILGLSRLKNISKNDSINFKFSLLKGSGKRN